MGISGGKDSAALAIYLFEKYPELEVEYYFCDTGKELQETYDLIEGLENNLGKEVIKLKAAEGSHENSFDHFHKIYGGYLPSSNARWCTKKLKIEPFEEYVGDDPVISYVGIRGDENREGYISKKSNIQSIFPFRRNIWSKDLISKLLNNGEIVTLLWLYEKHAEESKKDRIFEIVQEPLSSKFNQSQKLNSLLDLGVIAFNKVVYDFLKDTDYPLSRTASFPLVDNEDVLVRDDIFKKLRDSGVGVPKYYEKITFEVNGEKGEYARSRSGCYFCFFQQKIEWVWLYEQHPEKFQKAMEYEKEGYTWMQGESLEELSMPERIQQIKEDTLKRLKNSKSKDSPYLIDKLTEAEGEGCAACFI